MRLCSRTPEDHTPLWALTDVICQYLVNILYYLDQEEREQANILKQVSHHVPHDYVDHLLFHIAGVIQSPGASLGDQALAVQINSTINAVKSRLLQLRQDAEQLLHMTDNQLDQLSALALLSDLQVQARFADAGQTDTMTGNAQKGVT